MEAEKNLYLTSLLHLARSLAALKPAPWDKVKRLLAVCPRVSGDTLNIDQRGLDAIIALGIYYLESGLKYADEIQSYLLSVLKSLPRAHWVLLNHSGYSYKLPLSECFAFCLNTLLSDIAYIDKDKMPQILEAQLDVLTNLGTMIQGYSTIPKDALCQFTVPLFLGTARAIGRMPVPASTAGSGTTPLLCCLFPPPVITATSTNSSLLRSPSVVQTSQIDATHRRTFSTFRSIIPRTMSQSILTSTSPSPPPPLLVTDANGPVAGLLSSRDRGRSPSPIDVGSSAATVADVTNLGDSASTDPIKQYLSRIGTSFTQAGGGCVAVAVTSGSDSSVLDFKMEHLQGLMLMIKTIVNKDLLTNIDAVASEYFSSSHGARNGGISFSNPYKSFSETICLVLFSLLRDILRHQHHLSADFAKDVQDFVKVKYNSGQAMLQGYRNSKDVGSSSSSGGGAGSTSANQGAIVSPSTMIMHSIVACIEVLRWAIYEECEADFLCTKMAEKINNKKEKSTD